MNWFKIFLSILVLAFMAGWLRLSSVKADDDSTTTDVITTSATVPAQNGSLRIVGYASPQAIVYWLENGSVIGTQTANSSSYFDKTFTDVSPGIHLISLYASASSHSTPTITYSLNVSAGSTTMASGILLPPTLTLAANETKRPFSLIASGRAKSNSSVQIFITGTGDSHSINVSTNGSGEWSADVNPKLHLGRKSTYALALDNSGGQSKPSPAKDYEINISADLNADRTTDLTDFSIMMYDYGVSSPSNVLADVNDDGAVNLTDFSIMMYHWLGE